MTNFPKMREKKEKNTENGIRKTENNWIQISFEIIRLVVADKSASQLKYFVKIEFCT